MKLLAGVVGALTLCAGLGMAAQVPVQLASPTGPAVAGSAPTVVGVAGGIAAFSGGSPFPLRGLKGIPYSLVEKTTTVRTLEDGTTVKHEREMHSMRDGEGRTRIEEYFARDGAQEVEFVNIFDPVAGESIVLMPRQKRADVHRFPQPKPLTEEEKAAQAARLEAARTRLEAARANGSQEAPKARPRPDTEPLGEKDIAGVLAEGQRTVVVIPVGQRGNDRELRMVTERWTSPDLHIELQRTVDDPINGRTEMVVTQLDRGEPDAGLFRVPEGWTVHDASAHTE